MRQVPEPPVRALAHSLLVVRLQAEGSLGCGHLCTDTRKGIWWVLCRVLAVLRSLPWGAVYIGPWSKGA